MNSVFISYYVCSSPLIVQHGDILQFNCAEDSGKIVRQILVRMCQCTYVGTRYRCYCTVAISFNNTLEHPRISFSSCVLCVSRRLHQMRHTALPNSARTRPALCAMTVARISLTALVGGWPSPPAESLMDSAARAANPTSHPGISTTLLVCTQKLKVYCCSCCIYSK